MKLRRHFAALLICCSFLLLCTSCRMLSNLFGPKYGCPSNGKNVGAERLLSGEKLPKAKKFKS